MTKAWEKRVAEGRPHHGLGPSDGFAGNVQHLVSPIVGHLRLLERDGQPLPVEDLEHYIDRLMFVIELAEEAHEDSKTHGLQT